MIRLLSILLSFSVAHGAETGVHTDNFGGLAQNDHTVLGCDLSAHGFKNKDSFEKFFQALKSAKSADDYVPLMVFPLTVNYVSTKNKTPVVIKDTAEFRQRFAEIFPAELIKELQGEDYSTVWCNSQGAMIKHGHLWIQQKGDAMGVTILNK